MLRSGYNRRNWQRSNSEAKEPLLAIGWQKLLINTWDKFPYLYNTVNDIILNIHLNQYKDSLVRDLDYFLEGQKVILLLYHLLYMTIIQCCITVFVIVNCVWKYLLRNQKINNRVLSKRNKKVLGKLGGLYSC